MSFEVLPGIRSVRTRLYTNVWAWNGRMARRLLLMLSCLTVLTACIGPHKPVPTQRSQSAQVPTEAEPAREHVNGEAARTEPDSMGPVVPLPMPPIARTPAEVSGTPSAQAEVPVVDVKPVLVIAQSEPYKVSQANTATKTDTPIMQTPFSVQVVPQQVIRDQQAVRLETAVQNVSGVIVQRGANGDTSDSFVIRGFNVDHTYRNGVLGGGSFGQGHREMANVERVEVLKGPGAILYGRSEPGGIVNIVTKQPLATPYYSVQQQFGSYNFYRTTADATGPLTKDDTLLYRVNVSYENSGSFRRFMKEDNLFIAPVVQWNISPRTQITAEFEYLHFDRTREFGTPVIGNRPAPIGRNDTVVDPGFNQNLGDRYFAGLHGSHRLNADWEASLRLSLTQLETSVDNNLFFNLAQPNGDLERFYFNGPTTLRNYQTTFTLTGHINSGVAKHTLLAGYDFFYLSTKFSGDNAVSAPPFNIFAPTFSNPAPVFDQGSFSGSTAETWHGLYLQDQIELPYHIHLLAGARYDNTRGTDNQLGVTTYEEDRLSPRGGLLWQPLPWLSLYGSYTQSLGPSNVFFRTDGVKMRPQSGQQWEAGVKTEFWDGRLRMTAAYFDLTKQNIAVPDPANLTRLRPVGEAQTRGIELDITGEILPGWQVIAAYSYLPFAKITHDVADDGAGNPTAGGTGNRLFLAAKDSGSLWSTYEFQDEALRGLKVGGGVVAVGERQGDVANTYQLAGYVTANLMASYQWHVGMTRLTAQLNVNNLFDVSHFAGSNAFDSAVFGMPRFFMGSIRMEF